MIHCLPTIKSDKDGFDQLIIGVGNKESSILSRNAY